MFLATNGPNENLSCDLPDANGGAHTSPRKRTLQRRDNHGRHGRHGNGKPKSTH